MAKNRKKDSKTSKGLVFDGIGMEGMYGWFAGVVLLKAGNDSSRRGRICGGMHLNTRGNMILEKVSLGISEMCLLQGLVFLLVHTHIHTLERPEGNGKQATVRDSFVNGS